MALHSARSPMSQGSMPCRAKGCLSKIELIPPDNEHVYLSKVKEGDSVPKAHYCGSLKHHVNLMYWSKTPIK